MISVAASDLRRRARALDVPTIRAQFAGGRDYLAACTTGLPTRATRTAVIAELDAAIQGRPDPAAASASVERSRAHFAALVGVEVDRVAIGSQASVFAGVVATAVPDGGEVLCVEGDFSSIVLPFVHAGRGIRVRCVPLDALAASISERTALIAFSLVQSATGEVADAAAIAASASASGALTLCDATQAAGWMPIDATSFDVVLCHAYKWLCAPRGVAFATLSTRAAERMRPVLAGWYSGEDPWASCYGDIIDQATCARRFDVSPAWQAFVGAEPALEMFAAADAHELHAHTTGLAGEFRARIGIEAPARASAIVTWADASGGDLARLTAAGITASGRAGRARVAFHVFNDLDDVDRAVRALSR